MAKSMIARGHKKIAILFSEDEWTLTAAHEFRAAYEGLGGAVAFSSSVLTSETEFQTLLLKIRDSRVDGVYLNLVLAQLPVYFKQAYNVGIRIPTFTNFYVAKKEVLEVAGPAPLEGVFFYDIDAGLTHLQKKLSASGTEAIPPMTTVSYIATYLLQQAALVTQDETPGEMFKALVKQTAIKTPDGTFEVEERCLKVPIALRRIEGGRGVPAK